MVAKMLRPHYALDAALHLGPDRILALLGIPSMSVLLHVARLRQLLPSIRLRIREFWALARWDSLWLSEVRSSLAWLADFVSPEGHDWSLLWPTWLMTIEGFPGRWKALLRRAQAKAVQQEAWHAARLYHAGLLVRQLKGLGATLHGAALDAADQSFCCAVCQCVLDSYNKWSLHAFKKHGRLMQGRGLLAGTQCQACLKHFRTNVRLCRHLRLTPSCRLRLQQSGYACEVEPGVGSRRAQDPAGSQAPVLQAAGPRLPMQLSDFVEERQRPVAEVLDCLAHPDYDGRLRVCSDDELWSRVRLSFARVCASTERLRHTISAWAHVVAGLAPGYRQRLGPCVDWLAQADLVSWLGPDPAVPPLSLCTFRDSELSLSMLDSSAVCLPAVSLSDEDIVVMVAPEAWEPGAHALFDDKLLFYSHSDCLLCLNGGRVPEFMDGPFAELRFVLVSEGLGSLANAWPRALAEGRFQSSLTGACLAADLLRFLRLQSLGISFFLVAPGQSEVCTGAVSGLYWICNTVHRDRAILHRLGEDCSHLFHLFPN